MVDKERQVDVNFNLNLNKLLVYKLQTIHPKQN